MCLCYLCLFGVLLGSIVSCASRFGFAAVSVFEKVARKYFQPGKSRKMIRWAGYY